MHQADIDIKWLGYENSREMIPQMAAIDAKVKRNPYNKALFGDTLSEVSVLKRGVVSNKATHYAKLALMLVNTAKESEAPCYQEKVVGYVYYKLLDKAFLVEKLEVDPAYEELGVREKLVHEMLEKLKDDERTKLRFKVHIDDEALQILLRDKFKFATCGVEKKGLKNGDTAVVMEHTKMLAKNELAVYDPVLAQANGAQGLDKPREYHSRGALLLDMKERLKLTTGVAWDIVKAGDKGVFVPEEVGASLRNDAGLRFCTVENVANPQMAYKVLASYFGKKESTFTGAVQGPAVVSFPTEWVRAIHTRYAVPSDIKDAFASHKPALVKPGMQPRKDGEVQLG